MAFRKPVLGYPSKKAAIVALWREGLVPAEIAERCDARLDVVWRHIREARAAEPEPETAPAAEPPVEALGELTDAQCEKALRLLDACLDEVARAMAVDLEELRGLWAAALAVDDDDEALGGGDRAPVEASPAPPPPVASAFPAGRRVRLRDGGTGHYLHESLATMVSGRANAWVGTERQYAAVVERWPATRALVFEVVVE